MNIVSYAQNFEDVLLWRVFRDFQKGQYLDIGAQDPVVDSVSLAFYQAGWRGVHVEPTRSFASLLRDARPDEVVVEAVVTDAVGPVPFFEISQTGISTGRADVASHHAKAGYNPRKILVPTVRLDALFDMFEGDVHWAKIDVEGMETDVLRSWGESKKRPWILVIEATFPSTQENTSHLWRDEVLGRGYRSAFFDGLNCYFVHDDHADLADRLNAPANVYDGFVVASHHFSAANIRGELCAAQNDLRAESERADRLQHEAGEARAAYEASREEQMGALNRLLAAEQSHRESSMRLAQQHREEERELRSSLRAAEREAADARTELARIAERNVQIQERLDRAEKSLNLAETRLAQLTQEATDQKIAFERFRAEYEQKVAQTLSHLAHAENEREQAWAQVAHSRKESERLGSELRAEIDELRSALARGQGLVASLITERPGPWQRTGLLLGAVRPSIAARSLEAWAAQPVMMPSRHLLDQPLAQDSKPTMYNLALSLPRNPYLRADSLPELLSWEDISFVRCAYVTILGRQPDPDGEAYYTDRLRRGFSKLHVLWQLRTSKEGPHHDPGIAGLDRCLKKARWERGWLGWLVRPLTGGEGDGQAWRRHRAVLNSLERNNLQTEAIARQLEALASGGGNSQGVDCRLNPDLPEEPVTSATTSAPQTELPPLSLRERKIYARLTH